MGEKSFFVSMLSVEFCQRGFILRVQCSLGDFSGPREVQEIYENWEELLERIGTLLREKIL